MIYDIKIMKREKNDVLAMKSYIILLQFIKYITSLDSVIIITVMFFDYTFCQQPILVTYIPFLGHV